MIAIFRKVIELLRLASPWLTASALLLGALTAAVAAGTPVVLKQLVDSLALTEARWFESALFWIVLYAVITGAARLLQELQWTAFFAIWQPVGLRLRQRALSAAMQLPLAATQEWSSPRINTAIETATSGLVSLLQAAIYAFLPMAIQVVIMSAVVLNLLDWQVLLALSAGAIAFLLIHVLGTHYTLARYEQAQQRTMAAHRYGADLLMHPESNRVLGAEVFHEARFRQQAVTVQQGWVAFIRSELMVGVASAICIGLSVVAALWLAYDRYRAGAITLGDVVLVCNYALIMLQPLETVGRTYADARQALIKFKPLDELLALPADPRPQGSSDDPGAVMGPTDAPPGLAIEVRDLTFDAPDGTSILKGLDLSIPAGARCALVGETGSGKSTLLRLLRGLYSPGHGSIRIGDRELSAWTRSELRSQMFLIPQDAALYDLDLFDNVSIGTEAEPAATRDALAAAGIEKLVLRAEEGRLETVGERGRNLSGGERQRVGLARLLLREPRLILLDEATASLDLATEAWLLQEVRQRFPDATIVCAAHRLHALVDFDAIFVVDGGRIAESGPHRELIERGERYQALWRQKEEFSVAVAQANAALTAHSASRNSFIDGDNAIDA